MGVAVGVTIPIVLILLLVVVLLARRRRVSHVPLQSMSFDNPNFQPDPEEVETDFNTENGNYMTHPSGALGSPPVPGLEHNPFDFESEA